MALAETAKMGRKTAKQYAKKKKKKLQPKCYSKRFFMYFSKIFNLDFLKFHWLPQNAGFHQLI